MYKVKREYTINLLAGRSNAVEPCTNCPHKYKCDAERLACAQFRYFVSTSYLSKTAQRIPTREIYIDIFYKEPDMTPRKERA